MDERNNTLLEEKSTQTVEQKSIEPDKISAQKIFSSKKTLKGLTALLSIVCLYGIYYWGTPAIVD